MEKKSVIDEVEPQIDELLAKLKERGVDFMFILHHDSSVMARLSGSKLNIVETLTQLAMDKDGIYERLMQQVAVRLALEYGDKEHLSEYLLSTFLNRLRDMAMKGRGKEQEE